MKKRYVVLIVILSVLIIGAAFGAMVFNSINKNLQDLAALQISDVDMTKVPDGTYTGNCSVPPVSVVVEVTVKGNAITGIELIKHDNGQGASAEIMPSKVVEAQTLQVDIVTGATYSSKAILKAIENALTGAIK